MKLLVPYEGNENYVFAVFARKDEQRVLGMLEQLSRLGIRIWFDNGTNTGSNYSEIIANCLRQCEVFMVFVSQKTIASHKCRNLINNAIIKKKPVIIIYLEKTQLTPGMELQLSAYPSISVWDTNEDIFRDKLFAFDEIVKCANTTNQSVNSVPHIFDNSNFVLIREKTGEKTVIPYDGLRVGRRRSVCDYTIEGNKTLSRLHAIFTIKNKCCVITDNNSLNGIYINGVRLEENASAQLKVNDEIRLGSERFILSEVE